MTTTPNDADDVRFTSSPNWYCVKVVDSDGERLFAIGSRNSIVLVDIGIGGTGMADGKPCRSEQSETGEQRNSASVDNDQSQRPARSMERISIKLLDRLHADRISGVCFDRRPPSSIKANGNTSSQQLLLATVGDDLLVNVVDVSEKRRLASTGDKEDNLVVAYHREHKARIVSVTWSTSANELSRCVVSGDEKGTLISFNVASGKTTSYKPTIVLKGCNLTCVEACPIKPHLVAVGYQGGLIIIVDLRVNGEAMRFLRHHDDDIQALCWAPFAGFGPLASITERAILTDDVDDQLFASASKDRTFRVWSIKQEAPVRTFRLPTASRNYGGRRRTGDEGKIHPPWLTAHWPFYHSDTLLAGSHFGELIAFDLKRAESDRCWSVVGAKDGRGHSRTIFNVATCNGIACTVSMDRQVVFWDLDCDPFCWLLSMPTLGGYVYSLTFSPVNPGLMAIGCGDNTIRTWNTTSTSSPFEVETHWQAIKSKVTALSWHPRKEGLIAFGTQEGRVAVCNVLSNKAPSLSKNFHRKVVYTLAWGPVCPVAVDDNVDSQVDMWRLYSCGGDGNILVHAPNDLDTTALSLDKIISDAHPCKIKAASRTDIAFKPDLCILTVGNEDGTVELYDTATLVRRVIVCAPRKLIQCIRWHPEYTMSSTVESNCRFWLAVSSRDHSVHVHDLTEQLRAERNVEVIVDETSEISVQRISTPSFELVGHRAAVASIAWNPHRDGQLVSASFDGTLRVWNVAAMETMACFCCHTSRVLCVEWNPLDADRIASGGEDFTIRMWAVSRQVKNATNAKNVPPKAIPKKSVKPKPEPKRAFVNEETKALIAQPAVTTDFADSLAELQVLLERRRQEIEKGHTRSDEAGTTITVNGNEEKSDDADGASSTRELSMPTKASWGQKKTEGAKKEKRTKRSMFPLSNAGENCGKQRLLTDCRLLADQIAGTGSVTFGTADLVSIGAYGGRLDAYRLLKAEGEHHVGSANHDYAAHLELWKGNVADFIRKAAAQDQLNDWHLAMAPIVSHGFWTEICELYAKQLVTSGQAHKAVTFWLANQNVSEAIAVLKKHVSYKEAIVLAKVRLAADDPCVRELTEEWATQCERDCHVEQAAKCYLSLGRAEKAATLLAQRQDAVSFRTAAYVMRRGCPDGSQQRLADEYAARSAYECLVNDDRSTIAALIEEHLHLMPFFLVTETHRLLLREAPSKGVREEEERFAETVTSVSTEVAQLQSSLLETVHQTWLQNHAILIEDEESVNRAVSLVSQDVFPANPSSMSQVVAHLALKLSRALLLSLRSRFEDALETLLKVTIVLYRLDDLATLSWFFASVLPLNLDDELRGFFAFLNTEDVASPTSPLISLDSLRCYRDITFLREILRIAKRLPPAQPRSPSRCDEQVGTPSSGDICSWTAITEKLVSTVLTDDRSDVDDLRVRLDELKMDVASLSLDDQTSGDDRGLQNGAEDTDDDDVVVRMLSDAVRKFSIVDVCSSTRMSLKQTSALRAEPNRILLVGLRLLADRDAARLEAH